MLKLVFSKICYISSLWRAVFLYLMCYSRNQCLIWSAAQWAMGSGVKRSTSVLHPISFGTRNLNHGIGDSPNMVLYLYSLKPKKSFDDNYSPNKAEFNRPSDPWCYSVGMKTTSFPGDTIQPARTFLLSLGYTYSVSVIIKNSKLTQLLYQVQFNNCCPF